ncbi:hypothetical protein ADK86_21420 [Streptomyces sp. NRRL F-5755]|uniref:endonuclease/exonuclease/phosphatase family protein n=1 Tax=Streptomyces sp. NRRL F-5755 TaxID=1519475 RepID=UPI0006AF77C0|nr:endonuclease/exonuclease/phosphatase family protein [Streptomyces sp. NRRL F-5755]KOT92111.1 hypothetical protein ADK86_21420 [Streptomyces sp. NRRL F-5755]
MKRIRFLTFNALAPRYADWSRRRTAITGAVRRLCPDVVALQEVVRDGDHDGATELLGPGWHLAPHPRWTADGEGALLASRLPLRVLRSDPLRVTERTAATPWCGMVAAEVQAPPPLGRLVVAHHKPSWPYGYERERELQAVACARIVEECLEEQAPTDRPGSPAGAHAVVLGDFDAPPDSASMRFWTGLQSLEGMSVCYRDAWADARPGVPGHTFTPDNPLVRRGDMPGERGRRIDHVLMRCGKYGPTLTVSGCAHFLAEPVDGVQASDHYGVTADLTVPARPPGSWAS